MSRYDELRRLRNVGVTPPAAGDAGHERVRSALQREIDRHGSTTRCPTLGHRMVLRLGAGAAVIAVAVAVAVVTGAGSISHAPAAQRAPAPALHDRNSAYIVARVKAELAQGDKLIRTRGYASGHQTSDGSIVDLRDENEVGYSFTAEDGTGYARETAPGRIAAWVSHPTGHGRYRIVQTVIHPRHRTYRQTQFHDVARRASVRGVMLTSGRSGVQRALRRGQLIRLSATTVDGTKAIALKLRSYELVHTTLYVDARTYKPLRSVTFMQLGASQINWAVSDWVPATPRFIADAKQGPLPAGYNKLDNFHR